MADGLRLVGMSYSGHANSVFCKLAEGIVMKKMREVVIPEKRESVVAKLICDLCGRESPFSHGWSAISFDLQETTITLKMGEAYPDGGQYELTACDICPPCFQNKLIPWLKSQGVTMQKEEVDL